MACSSTALTECLLIVCLSMLPVNRLAFGLLAVQNLVLQVPDPALAHQEAILE